MPLMRKDPTYLERNASAFSTQRQRSVAGNPSMAGREGAESDVPPDPARSTLCPRRRSTSTTSTPVLHHDTPQQGLFNKLMRFESSRLRARPERARPLHLAAQETPAGRVSRSRRRSSPASTRRSSLPKSVPVYFTYITAWSAKTVSSSSATISTSVTVRPNSRCKRRRGSRQSAGPIDADPCRNKQRSRIPHHRPPRSTNARLFQLETGCCETRRGGWRK